MNYCILIKLSKTNISFWYQEGEARLQFLALDRDEQIKPLAFYVNGNDICIGEYAKQRAANGDSNAYIDYFEIIKSPTRTFSFAGEDIRPIKQLLYFGIERYLTIFFNQILFGKIGRLEDNKSKLPLCFFFEEDIEVHEKSFVIDLMTDAGYANIGSIGYHNFLKTALLNSNVITSNVDPILLTSIDGDIYVKNLKNNTTDGCLKVLKGLGNDPQCEILADVIFEKAVQNNQFIDKKKELPTLILEARKALQTKDLVYMGRIYWSDGTDYEYCIYPFEIAYQLQHSTIGDRLESALTELLKDCKISSANACVLLNGSGINTNYFTERLQRNFSNVRGISDETHQAVMDLIVKDIIKNNYVFTAKPPELPKPPTRTTPIVDPPRPATPSAPPRPEPKSPKSKIVPPPRPATPSAPPRPEPKPPVTPPTPPRPATPSAPPRPEPKYPKSKIVPPPPPPTQIKKNNAPQQAPPATKKNATTTSSYCTYY